MALDIYFKDDLRQVLEGLLAATIETASVPGVANVDHIAGVLTMGKGMALSFGLSWSEILSSVRAAIDAPGAAALLETTTKQLSVECLPLPQVPQACWKKLDDEGHL